MPRLALLLPALFTLLIFAQFMPGRFTYDDFSVIRDDQRLGDPAFVLQLPVAPWHANPDHASVSRPLTTATFYLQTQVHGKAATPFRAVNLLLFLVLVTQVASFTFLISRRLASALAAGFLFAAHPIHVEIVPSVVGRAETLAAIFALAAIHQYIRHREHLATGRAVLIALFVLLAGLSKEHGYLAAPIIGLAELAYRHIERKPIIKPVPVKMVAALAVVAAFAVTQRVTYRALLTEPLVPTAAIDNPLVDAALGERLVTPFKLVGKATENLIAPLNLSPDYSPGILMPTDSLADPLVVLGLFAIAVYVAILAFAWRHRHPALIPLLAMPVAWFIPSNTIFPIGTIFGDRLLAFLSVFAAAAVATLIPWHRFNSRASLAVAVLPVAAAVIFFSLQTISYAAVWVDNTTLTAYTVQRHPEGARFRATLARDLLLLATDAPDAETRDRYIRASADQALSAIDIWPNHDRPYVVLGLLAELEQEFESARQFYELAESINPRSPAIERLAYLRTNQPQIFADQPNN